MGAWEDVDRSISNNEIDWRVAMVSKLEHSRVDAYLRLHIKSKPWWLPGWLYRWLLSSLVEVAMFRKPLEVGATDAKNST